MDLAELRALRALRRPRRRPARATCSPPATEERHAPWRAALPRGPTRPTPGGCCSRAPWRWSARSGTEESVLGYMTEPGQWAGGFAAWDEFGIYLATGAGREPRAGAAARPPPSCAGCREQWFPFGLHFIDGLVNTVRRIESTARQREALVALGTLSAGLAHELNNPASAATRAVDALQRDLRAGAVVARPARGRRHHRRAVHRPRRAAPPGQRRRRRRSPGWTSPTARTSSSDWLERPRRRPRLGASPRCSPPPAPTSPGARSSPRRVPARLARPGAGVGLGVAVDGGAAAGGQGGHRPRLRPWWRPCGRTRRWTAPRCRPPTSSRASTARW